MLPKPSKIEELKEKAEKVLFFKPNRNSSDRQYQDPDRRNTWSINSEELDGTPSNELGYTKILPAALPLSEEEREAVRARAKEFIKKYMHAKGGEASIVTDDSGASNARKTNFPITFSISDVVIHGEKRIQLAFRHTGEATGENRRQISYFAAEFAGEAINWRQNRSPLTGERTP